jgi:hypothetical protein
MMTPTITIRKSDRYQIDGITYRIARIFDRDIFHAQTQTSEYLRSFELVTVGTTGRPLNYTMDHLKCAILDGSVQQIMKAS